MGYIETWKEVMQSPSDFYREMPKTGGYADPLTFAAISFIIYALLAALLTALFGRGMYEGMYGSMRGLGFFAILMTVIITPIAGIISLFIEAAILYIIYKVLGGTGSYEGTVRFISYATAVLVLSWIPIIGWIVGIYGIYLYIVGGIYVHDVSMARSAIAVLLPALLAILLMAIVMAWLFAFSGLFLYGLFF
ncbi:YIP1 family protein [Methanosarcina sp. UBA5]|uniref:YIP1 family protein n=1 Tax=Methanosarcina sp. UBA5 TaxID=1915593 RepID=UPI0025D9F9A6|nr:YIP1 family protein [Methanosarcina sp. UBA5]